MKQKGVLKDLKVKRCVCVCVCVCGALIQLYWRFFSPGVEYGFLCVYNVM